MHLSRRLPPVLASAALAVALGAPLASASTPTGAVSVRVEGLNQTLLAPTQVETTTAPMTKDGNPAHACPGTSALAALNTATGGNWSGPWNSEYHQYEILSIEGETHLFEPESKANYYWSFWLDERESSIGACEAEAQPGDRVLFFPACYGEACPPSQLPLGVEAPPGASVGEPVHVTVKRYGATGEAAPEPGATVTGASTPATTESAGGASVSFAAPGTYTLVATAPESVRAETTICVHEAGDGRCGTTAASRGAGSTPNTSTAPPPPYTGPFALVAGVSGLIDGHVYPRRAAPRLLSGTIHAHSAVTSVSLKLRRSHRGRCFAYEGASERFHRARCGSGSFFHVAGGAAFSYLLPAPLSPGRYVLDVQAGDVAGNHLALARGSSRIVFYVR